MGKTSGRDIFGLCVALSLHPLAIATVLCPPALAIAAGTTAVAGVTAVVVNAFRDQKEK